MDCEQRLKAAAKIILASDEKAGDTTVDVAGFGVTATLKPHQVEGVSWLIRRYNLGVNVILGMLLTQHFPRYVLVTVIHLPFSAKLPLFRLLERNGNFLSNRAKYIALMQFVSFLCDFTSIAHLIDCIPLLNLQGMR